MFGVSNSMKLLRRFKNPQFPYNDLSNDFRGSFGFFLSREGFPFIVN